MLKFPGYHLRNPDRSDSHPDDSTDHPVFSADHVSLYFPRRGLQAIRCRQMPYVKIFPHPPQLATDIFLYLTTPVFLNPCKNKYPSAHPNTLTEHSLSSVSLHDPEYRPHLPDHPPQFLWKTWNLKYQFPLPADQQISYLLLWYSFLHLHSHDPALLQYKRYLKEHFPVPSVLLLLLFFSSKL